MLHSFLIRRASAKRTWVRLNRAILALVLVGFVPETFASAEETALGSPQATLAEIETCVSANLPSSGGVIGFSVDAVDRTGVVTASRAELRWRKPADESTQVLLVVSEPEKTAGTALLIIDHAEDKPEFFVRLPEMKKVKKIRSRRLRGPVLGTDFSYEDLKRLREPLGRTELEVVGTQSIEGRPAWILEANPGEVEESEYTRVLTFVDQASCLPIRIDLFEDGVDGTDKLRKRLEAPAEYIRAVGASGTAVVPHQFVMQDLRRETQTVIRIESFEATSDLAAEQFTRAGLQEAAATQPAALGR